MALQGNYNFKGIQLPEAYFMVENTRSRKTHRSEQVLITPAVLNELDEIIEPPVYETQWTKTVEAVVSVKFYNTKSSKEENPGNFLDSKNYTFTPSENQTAKNITIQSYEYLKTLEEFEGFIDA
jgi:hypothetical protein